MRDYLTAIRNVAISVHAYTSTNFGFGLSRLPAARKCAMPIYKKQIRVLVQSLDPGIKLIVFDVPPRGIPANIRIYLIFLETTLILLYFAADNIIFSGRLRKFFYFCKSEISAV